MKLVGLSAALSVDLLLVAGLKLKVLHEDPAVADCRLAVMSHHAEENMSIDIVRSEACRRIILHDYDLAAARGDDENRTTSITLVVDKDTVAEITGILTTGWNDYQSFTGYTSNIAAGEHVLRAQYRLRRP